MQIIITQDSVKELLHKKITRFFQNIEVHADITDKRLIRIEVKINKINLVQWLLKQQHAVKTYWRDRQHKFEMAGVGEADTVAGNVETGNYGNIFSRLKQYLTRKYPRLRYYGGIQFQHSDKKEEHWLKFGSYRFVVPLFEVYSDRKATYFACNFMFNPSENHQTQLDRIIRQLHAIEWDDQAFEDEQPELLSRKDFPDKTGWAKNITTALRSFEKTNLGKIVLARKSEFEFAEPLDGMQTLRRLQEVDPTAFYFCFQTFKNQAFIGATPERLYRREFRDLMSEAVAGTRPRSRNAEVDERLELELLNSDKDLREHQFVVDSLRESFADLCANIVDPHKIFVLKLSRLQHLYAKIRGTLHPFISDSEILHMLHPTPAVGGYPKNVALPKISELEPFDRGWYAGPIGWFSKNAAEFAVAIRSGMVYHNKLLLYAGAGIVPGSEPEKEWDELENKISNFMRALNIEE